MFSAIIVIEYLAAIINLLSLITDLIILSGVFFSIYYLIHFLLSCRHKMTSKNAKIIKKIWVEKVQLISKMKNLRGGNVLILFLIPLSICLSLSISTRIQNYWNHPLKLKFLILIGIFVIILLTFLVLYILFSRLIVKKYKITLSSIVIAIICAFIFIPSKWPVLTPLPNKISTIEIINTGKKNIKSEGFSIKLIEIKDLIFLEKIEDKKYNNQINHDKDLTYLLIDQKNERDVFKYESTHVNNFQILFIKDKNSGIVKININGSESEMDLFSDSAGLSLVTIPIKFDALTYSILIADVISFIVIVFIICWVCINGYSSDLREKSTNSIIKPGLAFFLFSLIALFFITKNYVFNLSDEFSHWGTFVKELSILNELPGKLFCSYTPNTIPGYSLFQYLIIRILGFSEGHTYYAHSIFILAGIYALIAEFDWHKIINLLIIFFCMFYMMCLLPLYFFSLFIDVALGILFGLSIIAYLIFIDKKVSIFYLLIFLSAIQLIKTWGLLLAIIIFCIVICHQIFCLKKLQSGANLKKELFLLIIFFMLSTIIIQTSWQIHLFLSDIYTNNPGFYNINELSNSYNLPGIITNEIKFSNIIINLKIALLIGRDNQGLYSPFSISNIAGFLLIVGIILSFMNMRLKNELLTINILMALFFILNIILLLFVYMFISLSERGMILASFERYISEYLLGWFMIIIYLLNITTFEIKENTSFLIISLMPILLLIILFLGLKQKSYFITPPQEYTSERLEYHDGLNKFPSIVYQGPTRSKIFIIDQNASLYRHQIMRYQLCPNIVQLWGWSISTSLDNKNGFTVLKSPDEFYNQIKTGFDFVLIWNSDTRFWNEYGKLFPGYSMLQSQLFKVTNNGFVRIY